MCADPSAETLQICKMRAEGSAETLQMCKTRAEGSARTLQVLQGVRRGVGRHFARFSRSVSSRRIANHGQAKQEQHSDESGCFHIVEGYSCTCILSFPPKPFVTMSYKVDKVRFFPSLSTLDMNERSLPIFSAS